MIKSIKIEKYKSIKELEMPLGRINVLIGENGAGKSNILEAIALAGAAASRKLDNEFLSSRGIRVTSPEFMRPGFPGFESNDSISISIDDVGGNHAKYSLFNDNEPYSKWRCNSENLIEDGSVFTDISMLSSWIKGVNNDGDSISLTKLKEELLILAQALRQKIDNVDVGGKTDNSVPIEIALDADSSFLRYIKREYKPATILKQFIVYSPENSSLRVFQKEGQIEPLGINGEGLLRLLSVLHSEKKYSKVFSDIRRSLKVLGWFDDFEIIDERDNKIGRIEIKDRFLDDARQHFDQMSTNEGFLYLVFYFSLFSSELTPPFFAVDNIDASLNPKLCAVLMKQLVSLAKDHNKQSILTTHNPAILDGLNLDDDEQRLFIISRNRQGYTKIKRVTKKENIDFPLKLSEAFLRGSLGGLPKGF